MPRHRKRSRTRPRPAPRSSRRRAAPAATGSDLTGSGAGPNISTIGSGLVDLTGFPEPSQRDQMQADFDEDPRIFLERWIRDSSGNYNDGEPTQMPPHPEDVLSESALRALITFLLTQTGE